MTFFQGVHYNLLYPIYPFAVNGPLTMINMNHKSEHTSVHFNLLMTKYANHKMLRHFILSDNINCHFVTLILASRWSFSGKKNSVLLRFYGRSLLYSSANVSEIWSFNLCVYSGFPKDLSFRLFCYRLQSTPLYRHPIYNKTRCKDSLNGTNRYLKSTVETGITFFFLYRLKFLFGHSWVLRPTNN